MRAGSLAGRPVLLAVGGVGRSSAAASAGRLLEAAGAGALLGVGVAGGLTPDLEPGAVVWSESVVDEEGARREPPAWRWSGRLDRLESLRGATVMSVKRVVGGAEGKRRLARSLAPPGPAVVDLESSAWAAAAEAAGVPWLVLRAVSDAAGESLPLDFERFRTRDGGVSRARVIAHGLVRPSLLLRLPRLRQRVRSCARRLAAAAEELVAP